MSTEFKFLVLDANQPIEAQQSVVRELIASRIDLAAFATEVSHAHRASPRPAELMPAAPAKV